MVTENAEILQQMEYPTGIPGPIKKKRRRSFASLLSFVLIVGLLVACLNVFVNPNATYKVYRVLTTSMIPDVNQGNIIISKKVSFEEIKVGDVITFEVGNGKFLTHRVYQIEEVNGEKRLVTKGDSNKQVDSTRVTKNQVVRRVIRVIPTK